MEDNDFSGQHFIATMGMNWHMNYFGIKVDFNEWQYVNCLLKFSTEGTTKTEIVEGKS